MLICRRWMLLSGLVLAVSGLGCTVEQAGSTPEGGASPTGAAAAGDAKAINVDGSSTVLPISTAVAEVFEEQHPDLIVKVDRSGTSGGFDKFSRGETHISNASRAIKPTEVEACKTNGIGYTEVMIGVDGLTVAVSPKNDWCNALTIEQLAKMWAKDSTVHKWSDLDPAWPAEPIKLFGADAKSGTYDYFKEETVGKDNPMRTDYQPNSDDNVLVEGVSGDKYALGFFGFAYFVENAGKLKAVAIAPKGQGATAAVVPSVETIESGTYTPLSRPLFIYINNEALKRPEVKEFAEFHISDEGQKLVALKGYIKLNEQQLAESREKFAAATASQGE
jgi:phosphate transport system substrate-binding protein